MVTCVIVFVSRHYFFAQGSKVYKSEPLAPIALIELIIVFAILGVIAVVALPPDAPNYVERAKKLEEHNSFQEIEGKNSGRTQSN